MPFVVRSFPIVRSICKVAINDLIPRMTVDLSLGILVSMTGKPDPCRLSVLQRSEDICGGLLSVRSCKLNDWLFCSITAGSCSTCQPCHRTSFDTSLKLYGP